MVTDWRQWMYLFIDGYWLTSMDVFIGTPIYRKVPMFCAPSVRPYVRLSGPYLNNRSIVFFQIWYEVRIKLGPKPNILGFLKKILNSEILANFGYFSCFFNILRETCITFFL